MRNFLLIASIAALFSLTTNAQGNFRFGIKGGLNVTNLTSDYFAEHDAKTGYHFGILSEITLSDKFSLQPEVLFATQGTDAKVIMLGGGPQSEKYVLDYIQVPILAKIYLIPNLSAEIGPSFNFLVNKNVPAIESDFLNAFEFSGVFGVSYKIINGLFANIRYNQGLTDVFDKDNYYSASKNSGFQIGMGFIF